MLQIQTTLLDEVKIIEPVVHGDDRGYFLESYNKHDLDTVLGQDIHFVQDNQSGSRGGVLRGLHYQLQQSQGKLVRVIRGEIYDVAVDIRRGSPQFKCWFGTRLSAESRQQLWLPAGYAHGFLVLSQWAEVAYKTTEYYAPEHERSIRYDDPQIGIKWPCESTLELSARDAQAPALAEAELPGY